MKRAEIAGMDVPVPSIARKNFNKISCSYKYIIYTYYWTFHIVLSSLVNEDKLLEKEESVVSVFCRTCFQPGFLLQEQVLATFSFHFPRKILWFC